MSAVPRRGWLLALLAAGCFNAPTNPVDAGATAPADVSEVDRVDAPLEPDAPVDRPAAADAPPTDLASDGAATCASAADCPGGRLCSQDGRCVACLPTDDRCPAAQHCDPTAFACVPGCRADQGCAPAMRADGGVAPARCDVTRHVCLDCEADDDCPAREVCRAGQCVVGCSERRGCAPGEVCCTGTCVDVQADVGNCGACGRRCAVNNGVPGCAAGACGIEACTVGFADCNRNLADGCEADLQSDPTRCGACDVSCPTPPGAGAVACGAGRCGFTCAEGRADCDGDARTGCERPVAGDAANCGRCGNVCPARPGAAVARCEAGRCGFTCDVGRGDCDGDAANGCETDLRTAGAHCGLCGNACAAAPNATAACAGGRCGLACAPGFADCNGDPADGCEADLRVSVAHCGRCGAVCTVSSGVPACVDVACTVASCGASFGNCDGVASNGCETDTRTSAAHCGACGRACAAAPNATAACVASACATRCAASFGDCDGAAGNGCETDLRATVENCGACGRACSAPNGTPGCRLAACVVAGCATGWGNCDGLAANGCEVDLATSPSHCGACGAVGREVCDGRDNSCDGVADNGCPTALRGGAAFDYTSPEFGTGSGTATSASCPAGQVVRGVFGKVNSTIITELGVVCGTPELVEDRSVTPYGYAVTLSGSTDVGLIATPPTVGTVFRHVCPGSSAVTRIVGHASPYVYRFSVECSTLTVGGSPGSLRVVATSAGLSPAWGSANGSVYDYRCPSNAGGSASVLRGLYGRSLRIFTTISLVSSVGARCSVPEIAVR